MRMIVCLAVAAMLASCQDKQPYEMAVDKYLEDHLKDPGSYQNVELGSPQLITPMTKALEETTRRVKAGELPGDSVSSKLSQIKAYYISQGTEPYDTLGWTIHHKYRARNSYGALELEEVTYTLDKSQSEIINVQRK